MTVRRCVPTLYRALLALAALPLFACCAPQQARAQSSFPMLGSTFPAGVQRGKTSVVTVRGDGNGGANLYGAYKALFAGGGVKAEIVPPAKGWPAKDPKKPWDLPDAREIEMRVTVDANASLGVREYRLAAPRGGVSTVGQLIIGDEPEINEKEPNNDLDKPQSVPIPIVVNGKLQSGEDIDVFAFKALAGQELVFTVQCARLQDKVHDLQEHADPMLVLYDATGGELARNDDHYRADSLLHYRFEKAGEYRLQLRDVSYKGNPNWVYRLTMTNRPYVLAALPCAVRPGQSVTLQVAGYNLGAAKTVTLSVPADAPPGVWHTPLPFPNGLSNVIPLLVTDAPQTVVTPPLPVAPAGKTVTAALSNAGAKAPRAPVATLALPGGVNSYLAVEGQGDRYQFHARKGEVWNFEVTARRLDSDIDSELKLRDAKNAVLVTNDDFFGKDSRIEGWQAPADSDYTIEVRDLAAHAGPTCCYNLTATPRRPDFTLKCDPDRAFLAPGNRTALFVQLDRHYGFAGPVAIAVSGLPPGVTASALTLPPGIAQGALILTAAPDAKMDMSEVQITGTGILLDDKSKALTVTRVARPQTDVYIPGGGRGVLDSDILAVAVSEPNDLEVAASVSAVTLPQGGTAKIEVTLKRRPDFTKAVTLDMRLFEQGQLFDSPLPPGVSIDEGQSKLLIGENETKGYITLRAAGDAKLIADWPLPVLGTVSVNFVMKTWFAAPPLMLTVTLPAPPAPAKK